MKATCLVLRQAQDEAERLALRSLGSALFLLPSWEKVARSAGWGGSLFAFFFASRAASKSTWRCKRRTYVDFWRSGGAAHKRRLALRSLSSALFLLPSGEKVARSAGWGGIRFNRWTIPLLKIPQQNLLYWYNPAAVIASVLRTRGNPVPLEIIW